MKQVPLSQRKGTPRPEPHQAHWHPKALRPWILERKLPQAAIKPSPMKVFFQDPTREGFPPALKCMGGLGGHNFEQTGLCCYALPACKWATIKHAGSRKTHNASFLPFGKDPRLFHLEVGETSATLTEKRHSKA